VKRRSRVLGAAVAVATLGVLISWNPARAAGVYVDAAGAVAFLTAPQAKALAGRIARSQGEMTDASIYFIDATWPVKSYALVELDIPFINLVDTSTVETGLGDVTIRARARVYHAPTRTLHLLGALRTGTGTTQVWPYSSESLDAEAGLGYVDTLKIFDLWASATGAYVGREPADKPEDELHGHFARFSAGLNVPFAGGLNVAAGVTSMLYEAGRSRHLFLAVIDYQRSQWLRITFSGHIEGGERDERVGDYAIVVGARVYY